MRRMDNNMPLPEFAKRAGIKADSLRDAMREATRKNRPFPLGFAYSTGKSWVYVIPREPAEFFLSHGRLPDSEVMLDTDY